MLCTLIGAIILSINIHVGLNMHPNDDIGDASSSLRGSTSSWSTVTLRPFALFPSSYKAYLSLSYLPFPRSWRRSSSKRSFHTPLIFHSTVLRSLWPLKMLNKTVNRYLRIWSLECKYLGVMSPKVNTHTECRNFPMRNFPRRIFPSEEFSQ